MWVSLSILAFVHTPLSPKGRGRQAQEPFASAMISVEYTCLAVASPTARGWHRLPNLPDVSEIQ